jgi:hypothetical protein
MPFIDTNFNQFWVAQSPGITRNNLPGLYYVDSVTNNQFVPPQPDYTTGYTYSQAKNYQIITGVSSSVSPIGSNLSIRFSAPFKDSIASVTRDVSIGSSGVEFYTYVSPLSTLKSKSIVRYGANESFTQSIITRSTLNEIDFLINGYREYNDLSYPIDDISQPANGWYFNSGSYTWFYKTNNIAPTYSVFGSGLDNIVTTNFIAKPIEYDTFSLELTYTSISTPNSTSGMGLYIVRSDLLKSPGNWDSPIVSFTQSTIFATSSLSGTNTNGSKNYLVITALSQGDYIARLSNINIVGAYHPDNNRLQITSDGSTGYSGTTPIMVNMNSATYSHTLLQNGTPYILTSRIGNGLFKVGIWENGVWNSGWRDDEEARDFDDVSFSVLTSSDISWKIEIRGSTYSIGNFATGSAVSIGNIVAIDINDNRKLLKDYYKIENLGIGYNYSATGETQSAYGWLRVNLDTTFPYRRIEKDSQNHKIKVTKNIWLSGGFFNGYFSGVWNNGLFKGFPRITEMFNTHWIDGFFNGGHFNSIYSNVYTFSGLEPRQACSNGYINLTFEGQYTSFLPGDYILITLSSGINSSFGGIAQVIAVDHQIDATGAIKDVITIDKIFSGSTLYSSAGTILGSVIRYTATGLIQNFKFYDNNRSKIKSIDNPLSTAVFSFNSWIDVNYDETRSVTLGRDFRMYEPLTKKSINRNNLYGYPTYDVLSSLSRFRDSNTLDYKLYKLGTKYKVFTDLVGLGSGFSEPFSELDFSNFTNAGWTYSYSNINNFNLKRTENLISLNNNNSVELLQSGVTGDELYVTASNNGLVLNNNNVNISKSRYSVVEFDVITYSVTNYNFTYKNPDIYLEKSIDSTGMIFSETIFAGPLSSVDNTIVSSYVLSGPSGITVDDIVVMVDLYGDVPGTTINLKAPNGSIINLKKNGSGLGGRMAKTKFSLRDVYTKFNLITTPYSLNNTTISYTDTYSMDREMSQGDTPYLSDVTTLSALTSTNNSIYGTWTLYIKYNPLGVVLCDLTNWSISIQYRDLVSIDTEPISTLPILNFSNLNYDITTQLSGYDNVQIYKKMNYLPIRENVNHLKVKNTFRLDSIEESRPTKWGGFGKNQPTKKYEYFYNKTDMMLSINGNGATGASTSMVVLDNLNMYEVDMIPFFKYFDETNIYQGIQIPYIGEAPNIDYLNSDFVFIDNITVGVDAIDANGNNSLGTNCQTVVVNTTNTFTVVTNPSTYARNNTNDFTLNAATIGTLALDPTTVSWSLVSGNTITIIAGNTLTPIISGLSSGTYKLRVMATSVAPVSGPSTPSPSTPSTLPQPPITSEAFVTIVVSVPIVTGPSITITNPNKTKGITYSLDDLNLQFPGKTLTYTELIAGYSNSVSTAASIKITSLVNIGNLIIDNNGSYTNLTVNTIITVADLVSGKMAYFPFSNPTNTPGTTIPETTAVGSHYSTSFSYVIIDSVGNISPQTVTFTLYCTRVTAASGPSPSPSSSPVPSSSPSASSGPSSQSGEQTDLPSPDPSAGASDGPSDGGDQYC